jgi:hypothetical protein
MTATVTGSGTATRAPARARPPAARRRFAFPRASTTPGKVRLIRIRTGQATLADSAAAGSGAFTGLEAGVAVLALIMAIGSARGLSRRLAEYR